MDTWKVVRRLLVGIGVGFLQLFASQVVTFAVSLAVPSMGPDKNPPLFVALAGAAFIAAIFGTGWVALRLRWLRSEPRLTWRLAATAAGAFIPLVAALAIGAMEVGSPFFGAALAASIVAFHVPGWFPGKEPAAPSE